MVSCHTILFHLVPNHNNGPLSVGNGPDVDNEPFVHVPVPALLQTGPFGDLALHNIGYSRVSFGPRTDRIPLEEKTSSRLQLDYSDHRKVCRLCQPHDGKVQEAVGFG